MAELLLADYEEGLEPLDLLPPDRHAKRVLGIFNVIQETGIPWCERFVYFARSASGAIKIGSSCSPKTRVRSIQSNTHERVELITFLPGSFEREWYLHAVFAKERIRGEWFTLSERLAALIARLTQLEKVA